MADLLHVRLVSVSALYLCHFWATPFGNFPITIFKDTGVCIQSGAFLHKLQLLGEVQESVPHPDRVAERRARRKYMFIHV